MEVAHGSPKSSGAISRSPLKGSYSVQHAGMFPSRVYSYLHRVSGGLSRDSTLWVFACMRGLEKEGRNIRKDVAQIVSPRQVVSERSVFNPARYLKYHCSLYQPLSFHYLVLRLTLVYLEAWLCALVSSNRHLSSTSITTAPHAQSRECSAPRTYYSSMAEGHPLL